jgi:MFS family permease
MRMSTRRLRYAPYLSAGLLLSASYVGMVTAPLAIGTYVDHDHLSSTLSGLLSSAEAGSLSLVLLLSPALLRGVSVRTMGWVGLLAAVAGEALSSQFLSFWPLFVVRALVGAGCGSVLCGVTCAVAEAENGDRVMAIGLAIAYSMFVFVFPMLSQMERSWGAQALFLALAAALAACAVAVSALPSTRAFPSRLDIQLGRYSAKPARRFTQGVYLLSVVILSLSLGGVWCFAERIANYLRLDAEHIGFIFSLCSISMIAGCVAAGIVGDRFGHIFPAMAGVALGGIGSYGATIASGATPFAVALVVYNIAYLFLAPYVVIGIPSQLDNTKRLPAIATGALWLSYSLGITASGLLVEQAGFHFLGIVSLAGCIVASGLLALVALLQRDHIPSALESL